MAKLAIKGHKSRGEEVIEILEMLGGKNLYNYYADCDSLCFYMQRDKIIYRDDVNNCEDLLIFTLEEFLEKFPYKVGDRVRVAEYESEVRIDDMKWDGNEVQYEVFTDETEWYSAKELNLFNEPLNKVEYEKCPSWLDTSVIQPYKEETIDKTNKPVFDANAQCCDIMNQLIKEETMEEELIPRIDFNKYCKDKYLLDLGNYEIKEENGKTYAVRKQFEHPKTYKECYDVLKIPNDERYIYVDVPLSYNKVLEVFTRLLICRDAYWKIADWKPTKDYDGETFSLFYNRSSDKIDKCDGLYESNVILDFPTKELRDAFKENFNDDIEFCKEFL